MAKIQIKQSGIENLVQNLQALVDTDSSLQSQIGNLSLLSTEEKSTVVSSINELETNSNSIQERLTSIEDLANIDISLTTDAQTIIDAINENKERLDLTDTEIENLKILTGYGISLHTLSNSIIGAINELHTQVDSNTSRTLSLENTVGDEPFRMDVDNIIQFINALHFNQDVIKQQIINLENFTDITATLATISQTLSGAINELHTQVDSNTGRTLSLETYTNVGTILDTDAQNLADSINEIHAQVDSNTNRISNAESYVGIDKVLNTESTDLADAVNELHTEVNELRDTKLSKDSNLSDIANLTTARTNLGVYSQAEVDALVQQAGINLGTNYSVLNHAYKDALTDLTIGDNIFIQNDGDTKWAIYTVLGTVDGTGLTSTFEKIADEDTYLNANSKEALKATYESNPDTNAFTDEEQLKVSRITVTSPIDLDKVIQRDELNITDNMDNVSDTDIASSQAIKTYINNTNAENLKITENLSDLSDVSLARTNLDVYDKGTVDQAIINAANLYSSGDVTNEEFQFVKDDIAKMKKNYFFGIDLLGKI